MKKLPIGISDFKELIDEHYYYVDKTLLIDELKRTNGKVILLTRPRRFGKTLNLSMLRYFYEISDQSNAYLFHDKAIWHHERYRSTQGTFPLIFLSFKDCKKTSWPDAYKHIITTLAYEFERHSAHLVPKLSEYHRQKYHAFMELKADKVDYENSLFFLSMLLKKHYKKKVIILIDEYDTPIHAAYNSEYYNEAVDFIRSLFAAGLKDNYNVSRAVLTGILRAAKEGIFSGLNNLKICSFLESKFSDKFGFTNAETDKLLNNQKLGTKAGDIKEWYNGYKCGKTLLYNPWSLLECIDRKGELRPYWVNTSDNVLIRKIILHADEETKYDIEQLLREETIVKPIDEGLLFPDIEKDENAVWSLLFFAGYLTFDKHRLQDGIDLCSLRFPNQEVRLLFKNMVRSVFDETMKPLTLTRFVQALTSGDSNTLSLILNNYILNSMSSFDIPEPEPEKSYHLFILGLFVTLSDAYEVKSNRESGHGRYDILLIPRDKNKPAIIIEFKKVARPLKETLASAAQKALAQIHAQKCAHEARNRGFKKILAYGIGFEGKKLAIKIEQL